MRGGSWYSDNRDDVLSSYRFYVTDGRAGSFGFRVVVEAGSGR
jgi:formylglycine-generating enzyme required for sulfatase activity